MASPEHLKILKQGVEVWNRWREQNPDIIPDLKNADLQKVELSGANLIETTLIAANLAGADLSSADLSGAILNGTNLTGAHLSRADFSEANLSGANLSRADLKGAILNGTILKKTFRVNASTRRVIVEAGGEKFNEADSLRWKRVFIIGFPKDEKCNRLTDIQELRLANDDDEDGISIRCEISKAENLSAYQKVWDVFLNDYEGVEFKGNI